MITASEQVDFDLQQCARQAISSVLLIYNRVDPVFQTFGTESMDFVAAMYGAPTILVNPRTLDTSDLFHGKDQMLQQQKNTSFSAVGHLCDRGGLTTVTLFENVFAKITMPWDQLPPAFRYSVLLWILPLWRSPKFVRLAACWAGGAA